MILTVVPVASHDQESPVAPHLNCLDLRNAIVPLTMLLALCNAGANGVTCCISFDSSLLKENSDAIYDAVGIR